MPNNCSYQYNSLLIASYYILSKLICNRSSCALYFVQPGARSRIGRLKLPHRRETPARKAASPASACPAPTPQKQAGPGCWANQTRPPRRPPCMAMPARVSRSLKQRGNDLTFGHARWQVASERRVRGPRASRVADIGSRRSAVSVFGFKLLWLKFARARAAADWAILITRLRAQPGRTPVCAPGLP